MRYWRLERHVQPVKTGHGAPEAPAVWLLGAALAALLIGVLFAPALDAHSPAAAEVRTSVAPFRATWNLSVGLGARYQVRCRGSETCSLGIAVVGSQRVPGGDGRWIEVFSRREGTDAGLVHKALVRVTPGGLVFLRMVVRVPGHPPMELPELWLPTWARGDAALVSGYILPTWMGVPTWAGGPLGDYHLGFAGGFYDPTYYSGGYMYRLTVPRARMVGTQSVTTSAGTFLCTHWRYADDRGEVWVSKGAGPFGIVKAVLRNSPRPHAIVSEMVLSEVTKAAADRISGTVLPPDPAKLWDWVFRQRNRAMRVCLPWLGFPRGQN